ncbi:hypothetical protein PMI38_00676 [Pseudomonas sp. GM84]|nr:hypothetical protein PMI38_00676 [Pseudomonas sp. GM84]
MERLGDTQLGFGRGGRVAFFLYKASIHDVENFVHLFRRCLIESGGRSVLAFCGVYPYTLNRHSFLDYTHHCLDLRQQHAGFIQHCPNCRVLAVDAVANAAGKLLDPPSFDQLLVAHQNRLATVCKSSPGTTSCFLCKAGKPRSKIHGRSCSGLPNINLPVRISRVGDIKTNTGEPMRFVLRPRATGA